MFPAWDALLYTDSPDLFHLLDGALSWSCIGLHFIHCESSLIEA